MKIIWDPLVKQQIEQIFRFNQTTFGTSKAKHIVESIYQHINLLKKFPLMGTIEQNTTDWAPPYRYLIEKHCKIYYTVDKDVIYVALIWDTRQDPQKLWTILK